MDWLGSYRVVIDYFWKTITIRLPNREYLVVGTREGNKLAERFVAYLEESDVLEGAVALERLAIVSQFADVFSNIMGLPTVREVEFHIDLVPGTQPITRASYRMAPK